MVDLVISAADELSQGTRAVPSVVRKKLSGSLDLVLSSENGVLSGVDKLEELVGSRSSAQGSENRDDERSVHVEVNELKSVPNDEVLHAII